MQAIYLKLRSTTPNHHHTAKTESRRVQVTLPFLLRYVMDLLVHKLCVRGSVPHLQQGYKITEHFLR